MNGGWPELAAELPSAPELPKDASDRDRARHYGTVIAAIYAVFPTVVKRLDYLYESMIQTVASAELAKKEAIRTRVLFEEFTAKQDLPPMRPPLDSSHSYAIPHVEATRDSLAHKLQALAGATPGPANRIISTPEGVLNVVDQAIKDGIENAVREQKAQANQEFVDKVKAKELQAAKDIHTLKMHGAKAGVAFLVVTVLGLIFVHYHSQEAGHQQGIAETKAAQAEVFVAAAKQEVADIKLMTPAPAAASATTQVEPPKPKARAAH